MSTIVFNDATEVSVQDVKCHGDYLMIKSLVAPAQLRALFQDPVKTSKMQVKERGQIVSPPYEGYTQFYRTEEYTGQIYGVTMYRPERTPETQAELQQAAVLVAQIQAQELTDEQAVQVRAIYPEWKKVIGKKVDPGFKFNYLEYLYKVITPDKITIEAQWIPGQGTGSMYTAINETNAGTLEDPIPVPDTVEQAGFEYVRGKYYLEGDTVYLMNRQGMGDGETVILYFAPSVLVGQYFEIVAEE